MRYCSLLLALGSLGLALVMALAGCGDQAPPAPSPRPVRAIAVEQRATGETISLTGQIRAEVQTSFAFRLDGRLIERRINVGDTVRAGQLIGRLDPLIQQNAVRQAQASLTAADGQLVQARNQFYRQQKLLEDGYTPRSRFDQAQEAFQTAEAQVNSARAQLRTAQEQLSFTELLAGSSGVVTAIGAEPGEVVGAGKMIAQVAQDGGRDAVFDVSGQIFRTASPNIVVKVALTDDPKITATGRVREVAPQADPVTRTYQVKVGLVDPPQTMRLGATVTGRATLTAPAGVELPASALTQASGRPAVWVVDPKTQTVALRHVDLLRYDSASIVVAQGLSSGDMVVTAGVQVLHPDQRVRLLETAP